MPWHRLCQGICFGKEGTYSLARDLLTNSGSLGEPAVFELAQYTHSTNGDLSKLWGGSVRTRAHGHTRARANTPPPRARTPSKPKQSMLPSLAPEFGATRQQQPPIQRVAWVWKD